MNTEHTCKIQNYIMGQNERNADTDSFLECCCRRFLLQALLYGREYDISQLENIEVMETLSSAVSQFGDRKLPVYSVQTTEKKIALSFDCAWGAEDFDI